MPLNFYFQSIYLRKFWFYYCEWAFSTCIYTEMSWNLLVIVEYEFLPTSITALTIFFTSFCRIWKLFVKQIEKMFEALYSLPFSVLEVPNLRIRPPAWFHQPSAMTIFSLVLMSYFLVTGGMKFMKNKIIKILVNEFDKLINHFNIGIIYDVIVEPPSVGSTTDENGHSRPVAFMPYRINGTFITMFSL